MALTRWPALPGLQRSLRSSLHDFSQCHLVKGVFLLISTYPQVRLWVSLFGGGRKLERIFFGYG